jgi:hypothetical protein
VKLRWRIPLSLVLALILFGWPASAIEEGSDAPNHPVVVRIQLTFSKFITFCSGALIAPQIVVTADHCTKLVGVSNKDNLLQKAKVSPPGSSRDVSEQMYVNVAEVISTPREGKNGAAFLVLETALPYEIPVRIASTLEIERIKLENIPISFLGYGSVDKNQLIYKNLPQIAEGELFKDRENSNVHFKSFPTAPCAGDSGGPIIRRNENEILLLGVINGPWYVDPKTYCSFQVWNPEAIRQEKLYKYSVYIPLDTTDAMANANLAIVTANKVTSELKSKLEAQEKAKAEAEAAAEKAAAELKAKQEAQEKAKAEAEAKAAAELMAKQEAEAAAFAAAAQSKAQQEVAAKAVASKKTTITCVKGKQSKKVTALNPKCPTGYKKK